MKTGTDDIQTTEELIENTTLSVAEDELTLAELIKDIQVAHKELDEYKSGALVLNQALNERIQEAEKEDDEQLIEVLNTLQHSAFGVYLRVTRGDDELVGDREGDYEGYFEE
jgi:hypothetical protein